MVVDSCYNTNGAPNWCSSETDVGVDDFGYGVHIDIDTEYVRPSASEAMTPQCFLLVLKLETCVIILAHK